MQHLPIKISDNALTTIKEIMLKKQIDTTYALRLGIKGSGCEGQFMLGFDLNRQTDDIEYHIQTLRILIKRKHLLYLANRQLDFINEGEEQGFKFI